MLEQYKIKGAENIDEEQLYGEEYNNPNFWPTFQEDYIKFKNIIQEKYDKNEGCVFLRFYDGEWYFLERQSIGNIPFRHCSKNLNNIDISLFESGMFKVDYLSTQLNIKMLNQYNNRYSHIRKIDFPMEFIYSIVSNKWIFQTFKNDIGLIGGEHKIKVIKNLMEYDEYKNYLGIEKFTDYISIPERFSCDDIDNLEKNITEQLNKSSAKIFLFGIGISKLAIAYKFKTIKNAIYIDVGCGISALAGLTSINRPYYGNWINYRLNNYDYSNIDKMDSDNRNIIIL
jgi:hypothetical protein